MRYITGLLGILAALTFIFYSAVTQYWTAHDMNSQFKELAGGAAAGMVFFECMGLLFVRQCWKNGSRLLAFGGLVLVLAATVYLVRLDLRFHVAGQSDLAASRDAGVENRSRVKLEMDVAQKRRDTLYQAKELTRLQRGELARLEDRIKLLEAKLWDTETVNVGGMPEAGWASRMLSRISTDRQWWTDALMVLGLLFWALARMLALPLAVASMQGTAKKPQEARTAAKDKTPVAVALTPASPVSAPAKPSPELAKLFQAPETDPKPPASQPLPEPKPVEAEIKPALRLVETQPEPVRPKTRAEREEAIDATTRKWVAACAIPTPVGFATPSAQAYASYRAWCRTHKVEPLNRSWFGRSLARIGITVRKSAQGANYGLQITSEVGRRAAAG